MNRLAPLVHRRPRHRPVFPALAAIVVTPGELEPAAGWLDDARLFAGGWVAGLVLFGTLFA